MDQVGVLLAINNYLDKKTCIRLRAVCKLTGEYIKLKQFDFSKFNFSILRKVQMYLDYRSFMFIELRLNNYYNYDLVYTFLIYRYIVHELDYSLLVDEPFMFLYYYYIPIKIISDIHKSYKSFNGIMAIYKIVILNKIKKNIELIII